MLLESWDWILLILSNFQMALNLGGVCYIQRNMSRVFYFGVGNTALASLFLPLLGIYIASLPTGSLHIPLLANGSLVLLMIAIFFYLFFAVQDYFLLLNAGEKELAQRSLKVFLVRPFASLLIGYLPFSERKVLTILRRTCGVF